eukprot:TRINITY_DN2114_c0_g1_i2.p1 TRINITY_DN2114_c0_g1~~TRINITY_DN2114_c0_g1_i2.p1  ORF type:complete len:263 (-),score=21.90 TRINITY_DN2114_c0_g1_i2:201-989(-)
MPTMQENFCKEALRLGSLKGFAYFRMYLRGREELVITIKNTSVPDSTFTQSNYPGEAASPLSGPNFKFLQDGVPPASPSSDPNTTESPRDKDDSETAGENETVFLLGGYARYNCPYVWLRSSPNKRAQPRKAERDLPLKLNTTQHYKRSPAKIWDIVAELVGLNVVPQPSNPFALDHEVMDSLPTNERVLNAGAMAGLLQEIYLTNVPYADLLLPDLNKCLEDHFTLLPDYIDNGLDLTANFSTSSFDSTGSGQYQDQSLTM